MARRRTKERLMPTQPHDESSPEWPLLEQAPWPGGDDPGEDPRNERLARQEDISSETGEKFARYAALAILVTLVLFILGVILIFGWDLLMFFAGLW